MNLKISARYPTLRERCKARVRHMMEQEREEGVVVETWAEEKRRKGARFWPDSLKP